MECNKDVLPSAYLRRNDIYNLDCIADPEKKKKIRPFHCLREDKWPTMTELGLDDSQMKALKLALTKELVIIQGPPGTGETLSSWYGAYFQKQDLASKIRGTCFLYFKQEKHLLA